MKHLLYILASAMMFVSCTSCVKLRKGKLPSEKLQKWLREDFGRRYAFAWYPLIFGAAVLLLVYGVKYFAWYLIPIELFAGLLTSATLQVAFGNIRFLLIGPVLMLALQGLLWTS